MTQTGSSFHYVGSQIAAAEGITLSFRPLQKVGAAIGAIKSGQIDAWSIVPHIAKPLAKSGKVHMVGTVQDHVPNYQITTVFTSAKSCWNLTGWRSSTGLSARWRREAAPSSRFTTA